MTQEELYDQAQQKKVIAKALRKVEKARKLWIIIALIQIAMGVYFIVTIYVSIPLFVMGTISLVHAGGLKEDLAGYRMTPRRMYVHYKNDKKGLYLSIIFNFFLGGVVGIIPPIYELMVGSYIVDNEYDLGR